MCPYVHKKWIIILSGISLCLLFYVFSYGIYRLNSGTKILTEGERIHGFVIMPTQQWMTQQSNVMHVPEDTTMQKIFSTVFFPALHIESYFGDYQLAFDGPRPLIHLKTIEPPPEDEEEERDERTLEEVNVTFE